jgi:hypothetical protein
MPNYILTYDLRYQRNYDLLYQALRDFRAQQLALSTYGLWWPDTAYSLACQLRCYVDADDRLLIVEIPSEPKWAGCNLVSGAQQWLDSGSPIAAYANALGGSVSPR